MLRFARVGFVGALCAMAIAALPLLPAEHLHVSGSKSAHSVIHRHDSAPHRHDGAAEHEHGGAADSYDTDLSLHADGHGDHAMARSLEPVFQVSSYFTVDQPVSASELLPPLPEVRFVGAVLSVDARLAHGPPRPPTPSRAPPSLPL